MNKLQEIKKYRESKALSQSELKLLLNGKQYYLDNKDKKIDTSSMRLGTIIDDYITLGVEFWDKYQVIKNKKPKDKLGIIVDILIEQYFSLYKDLKHEDLNQLPISDIVSICRKVEYYNNYKNDTLKQKIIENCNDYYKEVISYNHRNCEFITQKELDLAEKTKFNVKNILSNYFHNLFESSTYNIEYQKIVYFKIDNIECKAMMDIVITDTLKNTIHIIDLKTTSDYIYNYHQSIKKYRYDIQQAFYRNSINENKYEIKCYNLVIPTITNEYPILFQFSDDLLFIGKYGENRYKEVAKNEKILDYRILGFIDLFKKYKEILHQDYDDFKQGVQINWNRICG